MRNFKDSNDFVLSIHFETILGIEKESLGEDGESVGTDKETIQS